MKKEVVFLEFSSWEVMSAAKRLWYLRKLYQYMEVKYEKRHHKTAKAEVKKKPQNFPNELSFPDRGIVVLSGKCTRWGR